MADPQPADPASALFHELAEALQATGNYLGALRRSLGTGPGAPAEAEVMDRTIAQWARAQHAVRELRACLNGRDMKDG